MNNRLIILLWIIDSLIHIWIRHTSVLFTFFIWMSHVTLDSCRKWMSHITNAPVTTHARTNGTCPLLTVMRDVTYPYMTWLMAYKWYYTVIWDNHTHTLTHKFMCNNHVTCELRHTWHDSHATLHIHMGWPHTHSDTQTLSRTLSLPHADFSHQSTHTHTNTRTHTHAHTHTRPHSLSNSITHAHTHTRTLTRTLFLSLPVDHL